MENDYFWSGPRFPVGARARTLESFRHIEWMDRWVSYEPRRRGDLAIHPLISQSQTVSFTPRLCGRIPPADQDRNGHDEPRRRVTIAVLAIFHSFSQRRGSPWAHGDSITPVLFLQKASL